MSRTASTQSAHTLTRRSFAAAAGGLAAGMLAACSAPSNNESDEAPTVESTQEQTVPKAGSAYFPLERVTLFSAVTLADEEPVTPQAATYEIAPSLSSVDIPDSFHLSDGVRTMLASQGFAVRKTYAEEFFGMYEDNRYNQRANLVTVDSLMHTYHLYFQYLLKTLEGTKFSPSLHQMSLDMLETSVVQLDMLTDTEWEEAALRNVCFFGVGACLLDPSISVPAEAQEAIAEEVARIEQASGTAESAVTGQQLDYSQFIVRGYYEGDEILERYFRAMMWYGQLHFAQKDELLDRCALLMTLALDGNNLERWSTIYAVTSFFVGASDDNGYYEYRPAIDAAYGEGATAADLPGNDDAWQAFHELTAQMPAPQINSIPGTRASDTDQDRGFRFMGQRFTIDSLIFQQLVYDYVQDSSSGDRRLLPDALDVLAVLGSDEAHDILIDEGNGEFPGYKKNLKELGEQVAAKDEEFWQASLYNQWLHTLRPLLEPKGEGFPTFMQSAEWARHNLESFLGSYTELKHDTILYVKQAMAEGDGDIPSGHDDRGYVEAEPLVFGRLARLCAATIQGLGHFGMISEEQIDDLELLRSLADQLATIATKELSGEVPTAEEFELIRGIGTTIEHYWEQAHREEAEKNDMYLAAAQFPAALVADVANGGGDVLELGTGMVSELYAVVPVDGSLRVASGPVFSFHQFAWPASDRLTDSTWREKVRFSWSNPSPETDFEPWTSGYRTE